MYGPSGPGPGPGWFPIRNYDKVPSRFNFRLFPSNSLNGSSRSNFSVKSSSAHLMDRKFQSTLHALNPLALCAIRDLSIGSSSSTDSICFALYCSDSVQRLVGDCSLNGSPIGSLNGPTGKSERKVNESSDRTTAPNPPDAVYRRLSAETDQSICSFGFHSTVNSVNRSKEAKAELEGILKEKRGFKRENQTIRTQTHQRHCLTKQASTGLLSFILLSICQHAFNPLTAVKQPLSANGRPISRVNFQKFETNWEMEPLDKFQTLICIFLFQTFAIVIKTFGEEFDSLIAVGL